MKKLILLVCACVLSACGGGSSSSDPPPTGTAPPPVTPSADNTRFLEQATFGPTSADITHVATVGYDAWLSEQFAAAKTGYTGFSFVTHTAPDTCKSDGTATSAATICARDNYSLFQVQRQFFQNALTGQDQLRQRVAFALSQIFVVSGTDIYEAYGMAAYQNMLLDDAFGNFRQLLMDVTLSPVMGNYLDMVNNDKPNATQGTEPNENYARELMQLFSLGVYQLNADGSLKLDAQGKPIATYDQDVVEGYAHVFTGWTYPPQAGANSKFGNPVNYVGSMALFAAHHDTGAKLVLNGVTLPAGQTPEQDLNGAIDAMFNHPNVGPFIGRQLIQHLVTSNPSAAYVQRISAVFNDNGHGVRGDLQAVIREILLDAEARGDTKTAADYGHLREPALFMTSMLRSIGGSSDGVYLRGQSGPMGQAIYMPPSVFNFYPPSYQIPGETLQGPEFAIEDTATALARANFVYQMTYGSGATADATVTGSTGTSLDLSSLIALAATPDDVVAALNQRLMHGSLSSAAAQSISQAVNAVSASDTTGRARMAIYLVTAAPQYQVEK